ncbi:branched-chain amino acid ABC transporter permease [Microbaculum marinisediminis]|uniref:Branched-chain amino acid ABC transporter permease n=1 Tax=Microbaculum marinisediminis TaxID=2931392 RepID=A0AAW5R542_9HYPH|nr:branched-chain amino acid ABC transporter permease [Microbaculum sp. A6E488]MCT8973744.1 branched-chain amino acid ABC transporter permease [Microbaculum sp. A6E488]
MEFILDTLNYFSVLMLVVLGLVVIFGLMNVINMAHGEFLLIGAYTVVAATGAGLNFWVGLLLAPLVAALVGLIVEVLVVQRIYHRFLDTILATWGISLVLKQSVILIFGPTAQSVPNPLPGSMSVFGVDYPRMRVVIIVAAISLSVALYLALFRSNIGLKLRTVIANRDIAAALGLNTRAMDRASFSLGVALAGFAGAIMAPVMSVDPQMGVGFLIPSFLAILLGGVNSLIGAVVGVGAISGATNFISVWLSQADTQIIVFLLAMVVIRFFPEGILKGRKK